jgi:WD40 repeat protein
MKWKHKWQHLLAQLETIAVDEWQEIWNEHQFFTFESETGIVFPADYQEFCQIWREGMLGEYMRIECPNIKSQLGMLNLKEEFNNFVVNNSHNYDVNSINDLLSHSFVFAENYYTDYVFWDLRTYSELDKSYDIYLGRWEGFEGEVYKIGRSFFEFVCDFCLGMKAYEVLPEWMHPQPQELHHTFTRFGHRKITSKASNESPTEVTPLIQLERDSALIWQQNIAAGVVFKMARIFEQHGELIEALLLDIKNFQDDYSRQGVVSFKAIKRLHERLGDVQFCQNCRLTNYDDEQLLALMTFVEPIFRSDADVNQQSNNFDNFTVESFPDPNAEFQEVWQEFIQSVRENLTANKSSSTQEVSAKSQEIQKKDLLQVWEVNFMPSITDAQKISAEAQQIQQYLREAGGRNLMQSLAHTQAGDGAESTHLFNSKTEQAWQELDESIRLLKARYPRSKHFVAEDFEHLHLPPVLTDTLPDEAPRRSEIEDNEMEQALRDKNSYAFFRYLRTLRNHYGSAYSITFSPDGQILASGTADATIKLWDLRTCQEIRTLTGHTDAVISVAISSEGKVLASGSADATIKLWNLDTSQEIYTLSGHSSSVLSVAISSNGKILASGSADRTIKLWNVITGQQIRTLTSHGSSVLSLAISPDGKILASGSADRTIKLWDLNTGEEIRTWDFESGFVFAVCFHPNGQMLFSSHEGDRTIKLWNLLTQEVIYTIPTDAEVVSLVISPDGQILAGGGGYSGSRVIGMWEVNAGKAIAYFHASTNNSISHDRIVYSVAFSPDGQTLASGSKDTSVKLWGVPPPLNIE